MDGRNLRDSAFVESTDVDAGGDAKTVSKPDGFRKSSPPLMTPPRRGGAGKGVGGELAKTMMAVNMMPHASADSGLVASMGDTLDHPKDSLPKPIMYPASPSVDDDRYTNPELFSNPGSHGDDLQAVDDRMQFFDNRSDVGSDNFILPPLPPDPRESNVGLGGLDGGGLNSLKTLQALMSTTAPNFLQQMLGLLPGQQKTLLLEQRQAAVEESASPNFSPVNSMHTARQSASSAAAASSLAMFASQSGSLSQGAFQAFSPDVNSSGLPSDRVPQHPPHPQLSQANQMSQTHRQPVLSQNPPWPQGSVQSASVNKPQQNHHHRFQQADAHHLPAPLQRQAHTQKHSQPQQQMHAPYEPHGAVRRSLQDGDKDSECGTPDDRPISGVQGRKTFEQFVEEQLATELQKEEEERKAAAEAEKAASGPTKRPFLRKGQGIARFSQPIKRPPPKRSSGGGQKSDASRTGVSSRMSHDTGVAAEAGRTSVQSKPPVKRQMERKRASGGKEFRKLHQEEDLPQQEKLKLIKRKSETGKKFQMEQARDVRHDGGNSRQSSSSGHKGGVAPLQRYDCSDREEKDAIPDDASFVAGMKEREKNEPMEAEELEEFEMLEDIADNMSLVSNSSVVARLITPNKQRQKAAVSDLKTVLEKKKSAASSPFERNAAMRSLMSVNIPCMPVEQNGPHSKTSEDEQNDTLVEEKSGDEGESENVSVNESDDDDKQAADQKGENRVPPVHGDAFSGFSQQAAEQTVFPGGLFSHKEQPMNGLDFSSKFLLFDQQKPSTDNTNDASDCPPSPTKSVTRKVATIQSRLSAANDTAALLQKLSARAGFLSSGFSQTSTEKSAAKDTDHNESHGENGGSTPPTSKLMSRLFPNLKPKPSATQQQQQQKLQMASTTSVGDGIQSKILREKLAELEAEIEKFRSENAVLEKLRRDREEGLSKLKEEIARFDQEKTAELKRLEEFKAQETKKLKQERKLFETYQKQVRAMPDKKDREEIEMLKNQLSDLQDEMKRKESRWTSNVTRLKSRITELEAENTELRDEMKLLERKRLEWIQTAKPPPTSAAKSAPRSSTPTNAVVNGYHDSATTVDVNNFNIPPKTSSDSAEKMAVPASAKMNASGAAGKISSGPGGHNASGGESMPRGQGATPSMIEGMSPMSLGDGGEGLRVGVKKTNVPTNFDRPTVDKGNRQYEETQYTDGKVERVYSNGAREVLFANGTHKEIASDGQYIVVSFFNGDIKQIFPDKHVVYYYAEAQTTHTTYSDRLEVLQFSNGQTEKHYPDGTKEITFPDQTVKYLFPNGTEESIFQDGTIMRIDQSGERILEFPNGQREIHTQQYKRREYPDGTVKTLHNDGRQETRYSTGRVRLKDKDGNILLDRMY
ncbi:hypothetical protein BaRGS_00032326 [Batillaria attramentaria]|uniref:Centromere protein J C-terminal domain-containing protein n=1 Tax=Batillaria attramentaria TaxID=370345 RepID=A0ABD0JNU2_9CAEN